jgi:tetratricopeptide (TPR) repeat protein
VPTIEPADPGPRNCSSCGALQLEGQEFDIEGWPFRKKKLYCPICLARLHLRINFICLAFPLVFALVELMRVVRGNGNGFDHGAWLGVFLLFQWLLIFPHELGHAIAGKLTGFSEIRILVGAGKPLIQFHLLGFEWLLNAIPFGGLTFSSKAPVRNVRRNTFLFVLGGPLTNLVAAIWAWSLIGKGELFDSVRTLPELFFWANMIVLVYNLVPLSFSSPFGVLDNDGKLLLKILFPHRNFDPPATRERSRRELFFLRFGKGLGMTCIAIFAVLALALGFLFLFVLDGKEFSIAARLFFGCFFLALGAILIAFSVRASRHQVETMRRNQVAERLNVRGMKELSSASESLKDPGIRAAIERSQTNRGGPHWSELALKAFPSDPLGLFENAVHHYAEGRYAQAEQSCDQAIANSGKLGPTVYGTLLARKLKCAVWQNDIPRANTLCAEYLSGLFPTSDKSDFLDEFASMAVFEEPPGFQNDAKIWIIKALELKPGSPSLNGMYGGILADDGDYSLAEPLLRDCLDRSQDLGDKGIASVYLAMIEARRGNSRKAVKLLRRASFFYPTEWTAKRTQRIRHEMSGS